jgi:hypothetical protein
MKITLCNGDCYTTIYVETVEERRAEHVVGQLDSTEWSADEQRRKFQMLSKTGFRNAGIVDWYREAWM